MSWSGEKSLFGKISPKARQGKEARQGKRAATVPRPAGASAWRPRRVLPPFASYSSSAGRVCGGSWGVGRGVRDARRTRAPGLSLACRSVQEARRFRCRFQNCFSTNQLDEIRAAGDQLAHLLAPPLFFSWCTADASTAPSRVRGCVTQEASPPKCPPILLAIWPAQEITNAGKNNTQWIHHCWLRWLQQAMKALAATAR